MRLHLNPLEKNVKVSHRNVIAHTMQFATFETIYRKGDPELGLGVLPQFHAYALLCIAHVSVHRGDGVVVLQGFDLNDTLSAIQNFRIGTLWLVSWLSSRFPGWFFLSILSLELHRFHLWSWP